MKRLITAASLATLALATAGCNSSSSDSSAPEVTVAPVAAVTPATPVATAAVIPGSVNADPAGEVVDGRIKASDVVAVGFAATFVQDPALAGQENDSRAQVTGRTAIGGVAGRVGENANGLGTYRTADGTIVRASESIFAGSKPRGNGITEFDYETDESFADGSSSETGLEVIDAQFVRVGTIQAINRVANPNNANPESGTANIGYFYGGKTDDVARQTRASGTATYAGQANILSIVNGEIQEQDAPLALDANFGTGTVTGKITNLFQDTSTGSTDQGVQVNLIDGVISGADYAGKLSVTDTASGDVLVTTTGANDRATFQGGFYGDTSQETAGVLDLEGTRVEDNARTSAIGSYIGLQTATTD